MLSRVANSIYWMSRYLERADSVARFIRVNIHLMLDLGLDGSPAQWEPLIRTSGDEVGFAKRYKGFTEKNVVQFLTFDTQNPNSIISCISNARENARTVREVIPSDLWESINSLYHYVQKNSRKRRIDDLQEFYAHIRKSGQLFTGLVEDTMSHGQGWHFARLGKLLERADKTARMLDVKYFLLLPNTEHVDSPHDAVEWGAVLKSAGGFEMYRKQFHRVNYHDVAQFLIFDGYFPRAMTYCIREASRSLDAIVAMLNPSTHRGEDGRGAATKRPLSGSSHRVSPPPSLPPIGGGISAAQKEMETLANMLKNTDITQVLSSGLHEFIDVFQFNLNVVDHSIYEGFFAQREV